MTWPNVPVSKEDAEAALRAASFNVEDPARDERCVEFAQWLVRLDEVDGAEERRTVTLQQVIEKAVVALGGQPRPVVHSRLGPFGADHDLDDAIDNVAQADALWWTTSILRHDLAVQVGERVYYYDAPRPERQS